MTLEHKLKKLEEAAKLLDEAQSKLFEAGKIEHETTPLLPITNYHAIRHDIGKQIERLADLAKDLRINGETKVTGV